MNENDGSIKRPKDVIGRELSACFLSQVRFVIGGVAIGTLTGRYMKSFFPLVGGILVGTIGDYVYGKMYACKSLQEEYDAMCAKK
jgi:hypothetical protein